MATPRIANGKRPFLGIALILAVPMLIGCFTAPFVFQELQRLIAAGTITGGLAQNITFERVTSRCIMIATLLLVVPAFRAAGLGSQLRDALRPAPDRWSALGRALFVGLVSIFIIYLGGWAIGAYRLSENALVKALGALFFVIGAAIVGLFEETFFRGFLFGALRTRMSFWVAAVIASLFFASVHFFRPDAPLPITSVTWKSAFELLPYLFAKFKPASDWPYAITLFLMGMTLCLLFERQGHLFTAIGLHAGWIWAMSLGAKVFDRNRDVMVLLFSKSDLIAKGLLALVVMAGFFVYAVARNSSRAREGETFVR